MRLVTERFGRGIDRGTQGQFCPPLGMCAGQRNAFAFAWPPAWTSRESSVGELVGIGLWLLDLAATVSLVCRTLHYSMRFCE